jgi:OCT family organic cation transporter-like MFS transporter 4/5
MVWLYTNELYPTNLRTQAIGTFSMIARAVGLGAPFIGTLAKYWQPLPLLLLGIPTCLAGILAGLLPETKGQHLPQTISQADRLFAGSSNLQQLTTSESLCMHTH